MRYNKGTGCLLNTFKRGVYVANYYNILGVKTTSDISQIEKAYSKLYEKCDPERYSEEYREICEKNRATLDKTREVLINEESRKQYDIELKAGKFSDPSNKPENNYLEFLVEPHPWSRYFARYLDFSLAGFLISTWIPVKFNFHPYVINTLLKTIIVMLIWLFFESILISTWGTTPGKWMFGFRVVSTKDKSKKLSFVEALKRSYLMFIYGLGIEIPVITIGTLIYSCMNLDEKRYLGLTKWDEIAGSAVERNKYSKVKVVIAVVLFVVLFCATMYVSRYLNSRY